MGRREEKAIKAHRFFFFQRSWRSCLTGGRSLSSSACPLYFLIPLDTESGVPFRAHFAHAFTTFIMTPTQERHDNKRDGGRHITRAPIVELASPPLSCPSPPFLPQIAATMQGQNHYRRALLLLLIVASDAFFSGMNHPRRCCRTSCRSTSRVLVSPATSRRPLLPSAAIRNIDGGLGLDPSMEDSEDEEDIVVRFFTDIGDDNDDEEEEEQEKPR